MNTPAMAATFLIVDGEYLKDKGLDFPVARELEASKLLVVCVEEDAKVVGACGVRSPSNILVLHVREGYRGQGIGTQLLVKTIQAAKNQGLGFITLTVYFDNLVATNLYNKFGFQEIVFLRKSNQVLMILPFTSTGKLYHLLFRAVCSLMPNIFLSQVHSRLYRKTLNRTAVIPTTPF